jgi:hypothetical protein
MKLCVHKKDERSEEISSFLKKIHVERTLKSSEEPVKSRDSVLLKLCVHKKVERYEEISFQKKINEETKQKTQLTSSSCSFFL